MAENLNHGGLDSLPYLSQPNLMSNQRGSSTHADTQLGESGVHTRTSSQKYLRKAINVKSLLANSTIADDVESVSSIQHISVNDQVPRFT